MTFAMLNRMLRSAPAAGLAAMLWLLTPAALATITYQGAGAVSDSNITSINPDYPASVAAGDLLVMIVGMKPSAANSGSVTTPEGWTDITSLTGAGGYGATLGGDTGNTNVFAYYKVAEGNETGSLRVRLTTNGSAWAQIYRLSNATQDWNVAGSTGSDTNGNAAISIATSSNPGVNANDFILAAMVTPTDVNTPGDKYTAYGITQTGVTYNARTEIVEAGSGLGQDIGGFVFRTTAATGTGGTGNPTITATASGTLTNVRGPGVFIRVRATGAITYQTPGAIDYIDATVATSVCPAHPANVAAGDLLVTIIGMKPSTANSGSVTTPSGWTAIPNGSRVGGGGFAGTLGADTGNTNVFSYYRVALGNEATERCFELTTNSASWAQMYRYSNDTAAWILEATNGQDATGNANVIIAMAAMSVGVTTGDHILGAMVIPTDAQTPSQFSAEAFSQTGITFGTVTEISEPDITAGNDVGGFVVRSTVTAGTSATAPTLTATSAGSATVLGNTEGPGVFIRIREVQATLTQAAFRFYEDGSEAAAAAIAAQSTDIVRDLIGGDSIVQLRLRLQETAAAKGLTTDDYQLQYSKNGGAYANVTGASTNVQAYDGANLTNGGASTSRLTGGSGTFLAGEVSEDGEVTDYQILASRHTEHLYAFRLLTANLARNDTLDFRVLRNGAVLNTYSVTPRITILKPVIPGRFNVVENGANVVTGAIKTKIAATNMILDVAAIKLDNSGVEQDFYGPVKVQFFDGSPGGTPDPTTKCSPNWTLISTTPASWTVTLVNGMYTLVGGDAVNLPNVYKDVRVRVAYPASGTETTIGCSSDNFAVRPASLDTVSVTDNDWGTASPGTSRSLNNVTATGGNVHKAGRLFRIAATARNSASAATSNYNGSPVPISVTRILPTALECPGCSAGTVNITSWTAASGVVTTLDAKYSEAGSISMALQDQSWAAVDAADSTTSERYFSSLAFNVGRFVPDSLVVTTTSTTHRFRTFGTTDASCLAPPSGNRRRFTYYGQTFVYDIVPVATFTGKGADGNTTFNYTGSLLHTGSISAQQTYTPNSSTLATSVAAASIGAGTVGSGSGTVTISSTDSFSYVRNNSATQGPITASISLDVSVSDASETGTNQGTITTSTAGTFSSIPFDSGAAIRYGRLRVLNASGTALSNLPVPMAAQYWDGTRFVTNTDDYCTVISDPVRVTFPAYTGSLSAGNLPSPGNISALGNSLKIKGGEGYVLILKPTSAVTGTATVNVNVGADSKTYLQGNWGGSATYNVNPSARAAFGSFGTQPRTFIFNRENY